ncbi:HlyC/CorC family transporter [Candidatus Dependentiae bacterium]|nr:HlyC/CorC family transporter [Candidatus Dependentiae bacterium]
MEPPSLFDHVMYTEIIGFVVALIFCAIFSFLETSITALRLFKLKELASSTSSRYRTLMTTLEENPHQVLITILIANNIANVTAAALITNVMERIFAHLNLSGSLGFSLGIGIATIAILIFGEVIPKNMAKVHGPALLPSTMWFTNFIFYLFYPLVTFLLKFSSSVIAFFGGSSEPSESVTSEHEVRFLIDYINEKGLMEREKTEMLQSIFKLGSKSVREIMVPASDIVMISSDTPLKRAVETFSKYQFSRFPIYDGTADNIIGMIHQKDVFVVMSKGEEKSLTELVRPILFVPDTMRINQLLREFREQRKHIAIVLNEHGIITGLVTLEDVLEEIVGDISDEYEPITEKIVPHEKGGWIVDGAVDLESLAKVLHITFEHEEDVVTLGGFLTYQLQHLPKKGESIIYKSYKFQVQKASPRRVSQVLVTHEKSNTIKK